MNEVKVLLKQEDEIREKLSLESRKNESLQRNAEATNEIVSRLEQELIREREEIKEMQEWLIAHEKRKAEV